ncbi:MAG: hypothetical protein HZB80_10515 [Deltaproteobacteria bacterium]|nr:hypothetical protein [Deltaproteobacteria bacterium]
MVLISYQLPVISYQLSVKKIKLITGLFLLFTVYCSLLTASYAFDLHGFLQGSYSYRTSNTNCSGAAPCDKYWLLIEERAQFVPSYEDNSGFLAAKAKLDFFHDAAVESKLDVDTREVYFTLQGSDYDVKVGRQIITWGLGDLVFVNDVFPKDWTAFIIGRPIEYLKKGIDGAKLGVYSNAVNGELVIIPVFEADTMPDSKRLIFYPFPAPAVNKTVEPDTKLSNHEIALRLYRGIMEWDASLYFYNGFYRVPAAHMDSASSVTYYYPSLKVYGASAQGAALDGVLSLEAGYYDSQDKNGSDPEIENSQIRFLVAFQKAFAGDFTANVQYYTEKMMDYSNYTKTLPPTSPRKDETRELYSIRLTQFLRYQTIKLSLFTFYSPTDKDYFINPEIKYNISDSLWANLGANLFDGEHPYTFLGQFRYDDNVYLNIRYEF